MNIDKLVDFELVPVIDPESKTFGPPNWDTPSGDKYVYLMVPAHLDVNEQLPYLRKTGRL